tara:strand:+ start:19 stop:204 length:186 start_codon:yes stop_codon:yes gene_type:complete
VSLIRKLSHGNSLIGAGRVGQNALLRAEAQAKLRRFLMSEVVISTRKTEAAGLHGAAVGRL